MNYTPRDFNFASRFWSRIAIRDNGCWEWVAFKGPEGYGRVKFEGAMHQAHRVSYRLSIGPIPDKLLVLHKCDNPPCCNPLHLFLGTDMDNNMDMRLKGREKHAKGSRVALAKFTEQTVLSIRSEHIPYKMSARRLSKKYGVHKSTIEKILQRKTWRHI